MSKAKTKKVKNIQVGCQYQSMRISQETKNKIQSLLSKVNEKLVSKKVRADQLIGAALEKIGAEDIRVLQDSATSNLAYFEKAFVEQRSKNKKLSKDDFFALVLTGKVKIPELEKRLSS